jgi:hypothetical protein
MPALPEQEVVPHAQDLLAEHLPLPAEGEKGTTDDLFKVLLGVAATTGALEAGCADLVGTPAPPTMRGSRNAQWRGQELPEPEKPLNAAVVAAVPRRGSRHAQEVALGYPDRPDSGTGTRGQELGGRGKAKGGATRLYRVATASLVLNGLRVTWALGVVWPDADTGKGLATLLTRVKGQGRRLSGRLLGKGFDGIAGLESLTPQGPPALSAWTARGTTGGPRALGALPRYSPGGE